MINWLHSVSTTLYECTCMSVSCVFFRCSMYLYINHDHERQSLEENNYVNLRSENRRSLIIIRGYFQS